MHPPDFEANLTATVPPLLRTCEDCVCFVLSPQDSDRQNCTFFAGLLWKFSLRGLFNSERRTMRTMPLFVQGRASTSAADIRSEELPGLNAELGFRKRHCTQCVAFPVKQLHRSFIEQPHRLHKHAHRAVRRHDSSPRFLRREASDASASPPSTTVIWQAGFQPRESAAHRIKRVRR